MLAAKESLHYGIDTHITGIHDSDQKYHLYPDRHGLGGNASVLGVLDGKGRRIDYPAAVRRGR
jgi:hypothetical protein